jgi:uncharacterized membrane protein
MLQGHVFHSFLRTDLRDSGPYQISQFVGGVAPAVFLFLTGVTLSFKIYGLERRHATGRERWLQALRRAGYLFVLAFLFRFQLWLFAYPQSPASNLLNVDILNCMGLAIAMISPLATLGVAARIRAGIVAGVLIACLAPLASQLEGRLPRLIANYFLPSYQFFAFFPWASFVAFGLAAGSIVRMAGTEQLMHRLLQWGAILGFGLILCAQQFSSLPYSLYPQPAEFWLNSPGLVFIKLGVILVVLAVAFLWTLHTGDRWSWIRQLGQTSLLVYWVHIELVYGRWFGYWKERLTVGECVAASVVLTLAMLGLSIARTRLDWRRLWGRADSGARNGVAG